MSRIQLSRRRFLNSATGTVGAASVVRPRQSRQARITKRLVIPEVNVFEDNYIGQFVFIDQPVNDSAEDVPIDACEFDSWSAEETQVYRGQLLDRRQEVPVAVDLKVYANGNTGQISPGSYFIIQNTVACPDDYIGLEAEWVKRRSLVGKPPGPTVTESGGNAPGFGLLHAGIALAGWVVLRAVGRVSFR